MRWKPSGVTCMHATSNLSIQLSKTPEALPGPNRELQPVVKSHVVLGEAIAQLILDRKLNITFGCCVQAQNWGEEDLWLIDLLKRAGLQRVLIGIESGSAESLKRWQKKATPADNRRAIGLFRSRSIYVNMGFIMFHPHSTRQEVMENASFLRSTGGHNLRLLGTRLEVYPGTAVLETLRKDGLLRAEYDHTLNPFAYRFIDDGIERLAHAMALLAGEEYAASGTVEVLPPHLQFAFLDLALHTQIEGKMRVDAETRRGARRLHQFMAEYHSICERIGAFNYDLFQDIARQVLAGKPAQETIFGLVDLVQSWYSKKIEEVSLLYSNCMEEQPTIAAPVSLQYSNSMAGVQ